MIILKFGGTSVSTVERLATITEIVRREKERQPIVVVSAIRGVTDLLLSLMDTTLDKKIILQKIRQIHTDLIDGYFHNDQKNFVKTQVHTYLSEIKRTVEHSSKKDAALQDQLISYGETISSFIVSQVLLGNSIQAEQLLATDLIVTDNTFGSADFIPEATREKTRERIIPLVEKNIVPVVTGFIGATEDGQTTTLGRGGSDYSAAILGFALNVQEIQIWTDVDGIYSADPRAVSAALPLPHVSYREASELAAFGAKVLHPRTIRPAVTLEIPVRVCNTLNPQGQGTIITKAAEGKARVAAIAAKKRVTLINLYSTEMLLSKGFLERIFAVFARHHISVDLVSVSEVSVSVTLDNEDHINEALSELSTFTTVTSREVGMVSIIGENVVKVPSLMRLLFSLLERSHIEVHMMSLGASEINLSLVIDSEHVDAVINLLHENLIQSQYNQEGRYL